MGTNRTPGGDFYRGNRRQLVAMVEFADQAFAEDQHATLERWENIFNATDYAEGAFAGSVHDYFYAQSYGLFNLSFDLQYVALSDNRSKYRSTSVDDENSQYLVNDVVDILQQRDIDWSLYDWNGDGYVNQLLIIFAGKGSGYGGFGGGYDAIWPHQWWLSEHLKDVSSAQYCEPRVVERDGKQYLVDCYCALQELYADGGYGSFGLICHEYSHCFGFPDFYNGSASVVSGWDLMDRGNYNGNGLVPCGYSAHERWLMGWLTPMELTGDTLVADMAALCDEPQAYLVRSSWSDSEYFIIENRQRKAWDAELPGSGIVVFHIDYDPSVWASAQETPNSGSYVVDGKTIVGKRYSIVPANDKTSSLYQAAWAYPYAENNMLTDSSVPAARLNRANAAGDRLMGKPLTDMAVSNGLASFAFMHSPTKVTSAVAGAAGYQQLLYELGPIRIVRDGNGIVKKMFK